MTNVIDDLEELKAWLITEDHESEAATLGWCIDKLRAPLEAVDGAYLRGFAAGQKRALQRVNEMLKTEIQALNVADPEIEAARRELMEAYAAATRDSAG